MFLIHHLTVVNARALCDKIGKAKCEKICEADKNPHACEHAKTMK